MLSNHKTNMSNQGTGESGWRAEMSRDDRVKVCQHVISKLASTFQFSVFVQRMVCDYNNGVMWDVLTCDSGLWPLRSRVSRSTDVSLRTRCFSLLTQCLVLWFGNVLPNFC